MTWHSRSVQRKYAFIFAALVTGAVLSSSAFRGAILDRSGLFVGHTPLPLPLANAALRSIQILQSDRSRIARLLKNSQFVKEAVARIGRENFVTPGPIVAVTPRSKAETKKLGTALQQAGIFPPLIHYPNAPAAGYFRFVISSEHTPKQLHTLATVLAMQR